MIGATVVSAPIPTSASSLRWPDGQLRLAGQRRLSAIARSEAKGDGGRIRLRFHPARFHLRVKRCAQVALGHNSRTVHEAYASGAVPVLRARDEYERTFAEKVVPIHSSRAAS